MPRPKSILWVDDEIEGLAAHRRFLEEQGFTVASATHGDDALALLRRQPYSVVLLDEQMPGRRGLELLSEIRAIDPAMPVVMVTQSEGDGTLREAIGVEVDDYLVKPVHPRQVLSVVTRLLEGDRIRQQRRARDFVTRFRELEAKRAETLAWREWIELVVELAGWEVRLEAAREPGLSDALRALQRGPRGRPPAAVGGRRGRVPRARPQERGPRAVHRGGLPAAGPVGSAARPRHAAVPSRGVALLQHPADGDAFRPQRDLLRHVPDGDRRAAPRLVGRGVR